LSKIFFIDRDKFWFLKSINQNNAINIDVKIYPMKILFFGFKNSKTLSINKKFNKSIILYFTSKAIIKIALLVFIAY